MAVKKIIFISAAGDLRSARDLVGNVLYAMGFEPVWQDIEVSDGGDLLETLRRRLASSAMVVQLVGQRYGAEPARPTTEFGRVSYTQFEALEAERLGKKVIYHFLDDNFPGDPVAPEPQEMHLLQEAYRQRLEAANRLRQTGIATLTDLELSIRRITDELAALRRQAERRQRNLLFLSAATAAGIAAIAALVFVAMHRQKNAETQIVQQGALISQQGTEVNDEVAKIRKQLSDAMTPKSLSGNPANSAPVAADLSRQAKMLLTQGKDTEDQALAEMALKQSAEADRIIQALKANPGNSPDETFHLLTMEGDNWYQAGEPDKAIQPYDQAMALKPDNVQARNNLALAHIYARLGSIADHQKRAIEVCQGTLKLTPGGSAEWAMAQINLGNAWVALPSGDRDQNVRSAIAAYNAALTVYTKDAVPADWALTQSNLGYAWTLLPTGSRAENLSNAIAASEAALGVYTKDGYPADWGRAEINLGSAWENLPTGDRNQNIQNAIAAYQAALTVYAKSEFPSRWAQAKVSLANALDDLPTGDRSQNVSNAIAAYEDALTVFTKDDFPADWANTKYNLGITWPHLPTGNRSDNVRNAIDALQAALTVYTKEGYPTNWAKTQNNLALAWSDLPSGDQGENLTNAIAAGEACLTVYTPDGSPADWALTESNLGYWWTILPTGDRNQNLKKAIAASQAALSVYTRDGSPVDWARTQCNLGYTCSLFPGAESDNLQNAITAYQAALTVYTRDAYPDNWTSTRRSLSWCQLLIRDFAGALATASDSSASDQPDLPLEADKAHALLFLGRTDEAIAIYRKHVAEQVNGRDWPQAIREDFDNLERQGLTSPEFQRIREILN